MALQIGIGNFSGAIASNIYRTQDDPRYILGREWFYFYHILVVLTSVALDGLELMFVGIGFITVPLAVVIYKRINFQRDTVAQLEMEGGKKRIYTDQELRELGDKAPDFRYML